MSSTSGPYVSSSRNGSRPSAPRKSVNGMPGRCFQNAGIPAMALDSRSGDEERRSARDRLVSGEIRVIFAVLVYLISAFIIIVYLTIIALYIVLLGFEGLKYKNAYLPPVFATIHIGYGLGYLHGIVKVLCKRPFYVETNR